MTSRRTLVVAFVLVGIGLVGWFYLGRTPPPHDTAAASAPGQPKTQNSKLETGGSAAADRSPLADALNSPTGNIRADLRIVSEIVDTFRSNFPRDGNPVGSNAEITATLTGRNRLKLALIPSDHPAINRAGELCDRWGTPFFFHAESASRMEIRSAGPDRKMWSEDDVVLAP